MSGYKSARRSSGWVMLEVLLSVSILAVVMSVYQDSRGAVNQRLIALKQSHELERRERFQQQVDLLFDIHLPMEGESGLGPSCQYCRGAELKRILQNGLYQ